MAGFIEAFKNSNLQGAISGATRNSGSLQFVGSATTYPSYAFSNTSSASGTIYDPGTYAIIELPDTVTSVNNLCFAFRLANAGSFDINSASFTLYGGNTAATCTNVISGGIKENLSGNMNVQFSGGVTKYKYYKCEVTYSNMNAFSASTSKGTLYEAGGGSPTIRSLSL